MTLAITVIKYFFITISFFFIFSKLLNIKVTKNNVLCIGLFSLIIQIPFYLVHTYVALLFVPFIYFVLYVSTLIVYKINPKVAFVTSVISYGLTYFAFFLGTVILSPLIFLVIYKPQYLDLFYIITHTIIGLLQLLFIHIIFKIRRFKKGMPFILQKNSNYIGIIFGVIIIIISSLWSMDVANHLLYLITTFSVGLLGVILIIWWRKRLTKSYCERLRNMEIDSLKEENELLKKENSELSKIIHKDNKLIPAMEMAVKELISTCIDEYSKNELLSKSTALLEELDKLSIDRKGVLKLYENKISLLPSTGTVRIDSLLKYMQQKAINSNVNFSGSFTCTVKDIISNYIDENSLATILADLIENAIIATKEQSHKNVFLNIAIENDIYEINIYDSGETFSSKVIKNLGITRTTTHTNNGGSGIGLMQTIELVKKHKASFCIDDTIDNSIYTKRISVFFDGQQNISIKSNRLDIKELSLIRNDIIFDF